MKTLEKKIIGTACIVTAACVLQGAPAPAYVPPEPAIQAEKLLNLLREDTLPFWTKHGIDLEYGGFLSQLERDGTPYGFEKYTIGQARMIYAFSRSAILFDAPECAAIARQGVTFLEKYHHDLRNGGWVWSRDRIGRGLGRSDWQTGDDAKDKILVAQTFALFALSHYYRATGDPEIPPRILASWKFLEENFTDPEFGGYVDFITKRNAPLDVTARGFGDYLHLFEAWNAIGEALPEQRAKVSTTLKEAFLTIRDKMYDATGKYFPEEFTRDWKQIRTPDGKVLVGYGHQVEFAGILIRSYELTGEKMYLDCARELTESALEKAWTPLGLIPAGFTDGTRENYYRYWTDAELINTLAGLARHQGKKEDYLRLLTVSDALVRHYSDPLYKGWIDFRDEQGNVSKQMRKGDEWLSFYHLTRCLGDAAEQLKQIKFSMKDDK